MLVLTRQVGQEIVIAGTVRVRLVSVRGQRASLGITAPASVRVDREEVDERRPLRTAPRRLTQNAPVANTGGPPATITSTADHST